MVNTSSIDAVNASTFSTNFSKPLYDSYCFSNIPLTIKNVLSGEKNGGLPDDVFGNLPKQYDKVILFFVDGFGWRFFEKYQDKYPFLQRILKDGVASKITSQFPSTTAAHVTSIHTGLHVGKSGIFEWYYYEPKLDAMISPLLFSFAGGKQRDTLKATGINPKDIYPTQTLYKDLQAKGITSYIFQHNAYTPSPYSDVVFEGATVIPYKTIPEAMVNAAHTIANEKNKSYYFFYCDSIDSMCHSYGPNAPQFEAEIDTFFTSLERIFIAQTQGKLQNTLLMMTADHGHVEVEPTTAVYINKEIPDIEKYFKRNKNGDLLVPGGSARDMFLYVKDEHLDELIGKLINLLKGKAEVYKTTDLIQQGFFGEVSDELLKRIGNVVILPYANETVWWYEEGKFVQKHKGHHGGLTKEEVQIPFLVVQL